MGDQETLPNDGTGAPNIINDRMLETFAGTRTVVRPIVIQPDDVNSNVIGHGNENLKEEALEEEDDKRGGLNLNDAKEKPFNCDSSCVGFLNLEGYTNHTKIHTIKEKELFTKHAEDVPEREPQDPTMHAEVHTQVFQK